MKFILGSGKQLKERVQNFPSPWADYFLASKILVIGVVNGESVSAYGIRGILNVATSFVKKEYRGKGVGGQTCKKAISIIRKQGVSFLTAEVPIENKAALYLDLKTGYKMIKHLNERRTVLILCPLSFKGDLLYVFSRVACSLVPERLLSRIVEWVSEETLLGSSYEGVKILGNNFDQPKKSTMVPPV